jgi:hypothetical protein
MRQEITKAATIEDIKQIHKELIFTLLQLRLNKLVKRG